MRVWELPCHSEVPVEALGDHKLVQSYIQIKDRLEDPRLRAIEVLIGIITPLLTLGSEIVATIDAFVRKERGPRRAPEAVHEIFPFGDADLFVGRRYPWRDDARSLNDLKSLRPLFFGKIAASLYKFLGRRIGDIMVSPDDRPIDLSRALVSAGGPIPNYYARNLMYGRKYAIPWRFRLDDGGRLAEQGPEALRQSDNWANWYLADEDGHPIEHDDPWTDTTRTTVPLITEGRGTVQDYFTIIRSPNLYNSEVPSLTFAGCHGLGTRAAGHVLETDNPVRREMSRLDGKFYQLLGTARLGRKRPSRIEIELVDSQVLRL